MGMSGMASTFSSSTHVTLWFTEWTTTTTATYVLTIFFLFFLGIFNRFLSALKSQLEMKWKGQHETKSTLPSIPNTEKLGHDVRGHARQWSRAVRQQPFDMDDKERQEIEPLSPAEPRLIEAEEIGLSRHRHVSSKSFWIAQAPWSIRKDGISAALEFVRALIGYVLMLAVMTYNIGFLFAVTASVLFGELLFGRYTRGGFTNMVEDGCHS
ncbi:hypothetical protein CC77DRAFT_1057098 [Alternaria alternata]|uniref:Copper transport protein n=1 Tax=Alternaria alternata TaxID=5599 RepID=A0A177E0R0_ALTAL|nr:hypothetical protein CC77DRAFT_1057098 [Alternaria alternata]OAG25316.1 hypothetical protein CC77DRAFT_1057098 [Alternaria alternata]RYO54621.1 hypothetical protein AA0116_g9587 [Alternaria tenuissima]